MWLRAVVGAALVAVVAGVGVVVFGPQPVVAPTAVRAPIASTTAPSVDDPTLPQPEAPPSDPNADVPIVPIANISIPSIGLDTTVYEGIWETVINAGPGHWPGTAAPGGYGNVVIAGHRVTHGAPFRHLDALHPGDTIVLRTASATFTYAVTGAQVVYPSDVWIADQRPGHTITLFACHPPGSARQRYVVTGTLVSSTGA